MQVYGLSPTATQYEYKCMVNGKTYLFDYWYGAPVKLDVEYDEYPDKDLDKMAERDEALTQDGVTVLRINKNDLKSPEATMKTLRQTIHYLKGNAEPPDIPDSDFLTVENWKKARREEWKKKKDEEE